MSEKKLVGGFNPSEKYEFVSWDDEIPNTMGIWKNIKAMFQSAPTSYDIDDYYPNTSLQNGAPKIAKLVYKWLNAMVYGRYSYSYWGL